MLLLSILRWPPKARALSSAEAPYERFVFGRARGERWEEGKVSSLFPLPSIPRALPFLSLPRPRRSLYQSSTKEASAEEREARE